MKVLATDLDRTLLPNGTWPADPEAIPLFNELTEKHDVFVIYVTGRNLALTQEAIDKYHIRYPHVLCGDVGTTINNYTDGVWVPDDGWASHVKQTSPRWSAKAVKEALVHIEGLEEQEEPHLNLFKQSYYVNHAQSALIMSQVQERIEGQYNETLVYSYDSKSGRGLLDVLPKRATKRTALEYVIQARGLSGEPVVFCGDSGNDAHALTGEFLGVMVRNADDQLVDQVQKAQALDPKLKVYLAKGGYRGLNGYYASGVLEGAHHYGVL